MSNRIKTKTISSRKPFHRRPVKKMTALDERCAERFVLSLPVTYVMSLERGQLQGRTSTTNLSGTGIAFFVPWIVPKDVRCHVRLTIPPREIPLALTGRVVWCRPAHGRDKEQFEVGVSLEVNEVGAEESFAYFCHFVAGQLLGKYLPVKERPRWS